MAQIEFKNGLVCFFDDKHIELVSQYSWYPDKSGSTYYANAVCRKTKKKIKMHRLIMGEKCAGLQVDHINMNGLDNRDENLRACTKSQNMMNRGRTSKNTTGFKGAKKWHKGGFVASITVMQKVKTIGYYSTLEEAARAYDKAAKLLHGEYARLNFPE